MNPEQTMTMSSNHQVDICVPSLSIGHHLTDGNMYIDTLNANNLLQYQNSSSSTQVNQQQQLVNEHDASNMISDNYNLQGATSTSASSSNNQEKINENSAQMVLSYDDIFPALPGSETKQMNQQPSSMHVDSNSGSKMRMRSSQVTQVLKVSPDERKFRDNPSSLHPDNTFKSCEMIMKTTNTKIETSCSKDGTLTFMITGKLSDVDKAKYRISTELKTQSSASLSIPKKHHKFILGKNYKKLHLLEQKTNTRIHIPGQKTNSDEIKITGSKEAIEKAIHALQSLSNELASKTITRLTIPKKYHPFLLGPFSENLNQISERTGAKINIPPPNVQSDEITINGKTDEVEMAKELLFKIYEETEKNCGEVSIQVKKSQHKFIIGKGGQAIQEIFKNTGVSVKVPPQESDIETIQLTGSQDKLGFAIQELFKKVQSNTEEKVDVERWIQARILGPKGSRFQELQNQYPYLASAHFNLEENKVSFQGLVSDVKLAIDLINREVNQIRSTITFKEIHVPVKYTRFIIGKNGASINQIRNETGVQITIPSETDNTSTIQIEGSLNGVEHACELLRSRIEEIEKKDNEVSRDLPIEQRFHGQIIGPKGEKIREIRERFNQVFINFPEQNQKSDIVTIKGSKENVDECFKYLAQYKKELLENNYIAEVPISKDNFKLISNNPNIKKIGDDTNTRISVNSNEEKKEYSVRMSGKKDNVEKARQKLEKLLYGLSNSESLRWMAETKYHRKLSRKYEEAKHKFNDDVIVTFPTQDNSEIIFITGPKDSAKKVKDLLVSMLEKIKLEDYEEELKVDKKLKRELDINYKQHLKDIEGQHDVHIKCLRRDHSNDNESVYLIKGKQENVDKAKEDFDKLIKQLESIEVKIIDVPYDKYQKYHLNLFFSRKRIDEKIGNVRFKFRSKDESDENIKSDEIYLRGPSEIVKKSEAYIRETLDTITALECDIKQKYHKSIMGPNWSKINRIQQEYDVHIKFPDREPINTNGQSPSVDFELNGNSNLSSSPSHADDEHSLLSDSDKASDKNNAIQQKDKITIYGKESNCLAAKEALISLTPTELEIKVPFDYHRYIIGQKGKDIRELGNKYDIEINVPPQELRSDYITLIGLKEKVEEAKKIIEEKVAKYDEEKEDKIAKSFRLEIRVDPKYHPKIIGKKGYHITSLRKNYDVNVLFPEKHDRQQHSEEHFKDEDLITIIGYQKNANAAANEINKLVDELSNRISIDLDIDSRIHARLIGAKGKHVKKLMERFKVEIKFPRSTDPNPNLITISGNPEDVEEAKNHIFELTEDYMADVGEKPTLEHRTLAMFTKDDSSMNSTNNINTPNNDNLNNNNSEEPSGKGFLVHGGPWEQNKNGGEMIPPDTTNTDEFPSMSIDSINDQSKVCWGPPIPKLPSSSVTYQSNCSQLE